MGFVVEPDEVLLYQGLADEEEGIRHAVVLLEFARSPSQNFVVLHDLDALSLQFALSAPEKGSL
jgi:hypothetical protein